MSSSARSPLHYSQSTTFTTSTTVPPFFRRKVMSITQTYYLAHTARGKLSHEAARADHNLRFLVGHANLLDALMLELAEAEQEQETWFNQSVRGATKSEEAHIQWADTLIEEPDEDWQAEDADSDADSDSNSEYDEDEELEFAFASLRRVDSYTTLPQSHPVEEEEEEEEEEENPYEDDEEEDYAMLGLSRTQSHPPSPPELSHDSEEDSSEDESMPPSPPSDALLSFGQKQRQSPNPKLSPSGEAVFFDDAFYLPSRNVPALVSSISVY